MTKKLMGKKLGMTQVFLKDGRVVAGTVIQFEPNVITQIKTKENDGYNAIQVAYSVVETKDPRTVAKRVSKPLRGHFAKNDIKARRHIAEIRMDSVEEFTVGQEFGVDIFELDELLDVTGKSKGKGFQGVQKRHGFRGGPGSHGSHFHRAPGSLGMRSTPGRVFPERPMPGHMGAEKVTVEHLAVLKIVPEENIIVLKGAVPGPQGGLVTVRKSVKCTQAK